MSPQEIQVLQNFLDQLVQVQGVNKDPVALEMITAAVNKQADASYLLVQRALLLDQAMANANSQIASLQADLREQKALVAALSTSSGGSSNSSFLDPAVSGWGNSAHSRPLNVQPVGNTSDYPATTSVTGAPLAAYPAMGAAQVQSVQPVQYVQPASSSFFGGNTGSVLGTVAATAAGVAAGAFLYQGISHMMGGNESRGMGNNFSDLNSGNNLNSNNEGGLIPGYFDQDQPQVSAIDSVSDDTSSSGDHGSDDT
ncbi:DUF2076 family protein [Undibacterium sp. SXout11W]|uniref:DUF2076 family protein n=1 Tax=Undibacterium sp. SXout11W TaxID=3413050 RepID=UPI003BF16A22